MITFITTKLSKELLTQEWITFFCDFDIKYEYRTSHLISILLR